MLPCEFWSEYATILVPCHFGVFASFIASLWCVFRVILYVTVQCVSRNSLRHCGVCFASFFRVIFLRHCAVSFASFFTLLCCVFRLILCVTVLWTARLRKHSMVLTTPTHKPKKPATWRLPIKPVLPISPLTWMI